MFRGWIGNAEREAGRFEAFAARLGLDPDFLAMFGVGWTGCEWSFPMFDHLGNCVGIRLRRPRPGMPDAKYSVTGGREGLFLPVRLPATGEIFLTEGPTDSIALFQLGFAAAGRPSCRGGEDHALQLARGRDVIVVADRDKPGLDGAAHLAARMRLVAPKVRMLVPPEPFKDVRDWLTQAKVDHQQVQSIIDALPLQALEVAWS